MVNSNVEMLGSVCVWVRDDERVGGWVPFYSIPNSQQETVSSFLVTREDKAGP